MKDGKSLFRILNLAFWITLFILLLFALPFIKKETFSHNEFSQWQKQFDTTLIEIDSSFISDDDKNQIDTLNRDQDSANKQLEHFHWRWRDYDGNRCELKFSIPEHEFTKAERYRNNYNSYLFDQAQLYQDFIEISEIPLKIISEAFTKEMNRRRLQGIDRLNFVVSAIQTPPYTYVKLGDCENATRCAPDGCCGHIRPYAVYTPTEYIFQETGDCDTKSLICYAILKSHGINAALICGDTDGGLHAMLGVAEYHPVIPSRSIRENGVLYHPWETTNFDHSFQLGNMRMWRIWRGWHVTNN
jgi:hypothetical protein